MNETFVHTVRVGCIFATKPYTTVSVI